MTSIVTLYERVVQGRASAAASTFTTQLGEPVYPSNMDRATPILKMDLTIQKIFCYISANQVKLES